MGDADEGWEAGAPAAAGSPRGEGHPEDIVDPSDVVVHGRGGEEEVLAVLEDIAAASEASSRAQASSPSDATRASREFKSKDEFAALLERMRSKQAAVKLRKLFLYSGECNVMQEIWIQDKSNPDAQRDPLKSYAVVHVHHHARVSVARDIESSHLEVVDAINARHLAVGGAKYQRDNPFFDTFIEPSGHTTFKVFPSAPEWKCTKCQQTNFQSKPKCRGRNGADCSGRRPCTTWKWKQQKSWNEGLARILEEAAEAMQWPSRSGKSMHRAAGGASSDVESDTESFAMHDLMESYRQRTRLPRKDLPRQATPVTGSEPCSECNQIPCSASCKAWYNLRAAVLCIGLDKYENLVHLANAERDAREIQRRVNALPRCRAEVLDHRYVRDRSTFVRGVRTFLTREGMKATPPDVVATIYSGHGTYHKGWGE